MSNNPYQLLQQRYQNHIPQKGKRSYQGKGYNKSWIEEIDSPLVRYQNLSKQITDRLIEAKDIKYLEMSDKSNDYMVDNRYQRSQKVIKMIEEIEKEYKNYCIAMLTINQRKGILDPKDWKDYSKIIDKIRNNLKMNKTMKRYISKIAYVTEVGKKSKKWHIHVIVIIPLGEEWRKRKEKVSKIDLKMEINRFEIMTVLQWIVKTIEGDWVDYNTRYHGWIGKDYYYYYHWLNNMEYCFGEMEEKNRIRGGMMYLCKMGYDTALCMLEERMRGGRIKGFGIINVLYDNSRINRNRIE